ncbi:UvrD/REP helicase N-terminal domain-containing protein [Xenorhabdus koppenhoeferi]|uniref:UvrD/REP helicase N-terminal domain-containing protein n=1 Tax=Xenorhabdus koppenhoeferi TaxID=351659 RepID=A0A1I7ESP7_9GAMM|nr:UvrD/REP helicase N-terminal domain-containing protein [Xenorhabdus koppenhoeferi]
MLSQLVHFPSNTKVITTHALAYRFLKNLKLKIKFNFNEFDVARLLNITSIQLQFLIIETLNNYYRSADYTLQIQHVLTENASSGKKHSENLRKDALEKARLIFELQADPKSQFPAPPDFYIKYFQLVAPPLDTWFDIILFDEAQDANLVTKALLDKCQCKRIFVGDTHQMINRWRGANDALECVCTGRSLTTSYRFGRCVAAIANAILMLKGETVSLKTTGITDKLVSKAEIILAEHPLPPYLVQILLRLQAHYHYLVGRITEIETALSQEIIQDDTGHRLMTIPGIGPITASVLSSQPGDGKQYSCSRDFAASMGLVPRQYTNIVACALANKLARIDLSKPKIYQKLVLQKRGEP